MARLFQTSIAEPNDETHHPRRIPAGNNRRVLVRNN